MGRPRRKRKMSSSTKLVAYIIIGIVVGSAVGYFAAGPLSYDTQIATLNKQLADAQASSSSSTTALQSELSTARSTITSLQAQIQTLQGQLSEAENPTLKGSLSISGSTTVQPISQEAANEFMKLHNGVQVSVAGGGSGAGIKAAGAGQVDIGESSRVITESELIQYPKLVVTGIAKDSIAVVVNPSLTGVSDLTFEQVAKIFAGEITNWKDIGGPDHAINVYTRESGSGTLGTFNEYFMTPTTGPASKQWTRTISATASVKASNGEMKTAISGDTYGIAYISLGFVDSSVKALKIAGVEATIDNVNSGKYTVQRVLWVFTNGQPSELEQAFIDYLLSPAGQKIVTDMGYIAIYS
jgi:phosphate transport system substrate-binding protein